jgi:hypothetical protein
VEVPQAVIRIMGPRPAQEAPGGAGQGRALSAAGSFGAALFLQALVLLRWSHADLADSFSPGSRYEKTTGS